MIGFLVGYILGIGTGITYYNKITSENKYNSYIVNFLENLIQIFRK